MIYINLDSFRKYNNYYFLIFINIYDDNQNKHS